MHVTNGRTGSDASPLHGAARTGKPLRLHGVARMYGCCLTANRTSIFQQIYLTATLTNLEVHCPLCASRTAARTCTACPTWTIARNCTEPMQRHCKLHVGARHCTAVSCGIHNIVKGDPLVSKHQGPKVYTSTSEHRNQNL